jgi:hypothetical protein
MFKFLKLRNVAVVAFVLSLSFISAQSNKSNNGFLTDPDNIILNRDSTWGLDFDYNEIDPATVKLSLLAAKISKLKAYNDSMMMLVRMRNIKERSDSLEELYDLLAGDSSSSYNAYTFFAGQYHTSVSGLNKGLSSQGFPHIQDNSFHLTNFLNFTWKRNHIMNEIFIANGTSRSVSKGDISVSYGYISPVNYNIGYCLIDKKRIQFFPYAGLLYQSSYLEFVNNGIQPFDLGASN